MQLRSRVFTVEHVPVRLHQRRQEQRQEGTGADVRRHARRVPWVEVVAGTRHCSIAPPVDVFGGVGHAVDGVVAGEVGGDRLLQGGVEVRRQRRAAPTLAAHHAHPRLAVHLHPCDTGAGEVGVHVTVQREGVADHAHARHHRRVPPHAGLDLVQPLRALREHQLRLVCGRAGVLHADAGPVGGQAVPAVDVVHPEGCLQAVHHAGQVLFCPRIVVVRPGIGMRELPVGLHGGEAPGEISRSCIELQQHFPERPGGQVREQPHRPALGGRGINNPLVEFEKGHFQGPHRQPCRTLNDRDYQPHDGSHQPLPGPAALLNGCGARLHYILPLLVRRQGARRNSLFLQFELVSSRWLHLCRRFLQCR
mmetsp:Transcript_20889/g.62855  ORF Transcript_20889/g.62855 Transcript_20889/m.62855 type:complete len:364 (+) Transcript_20889:1467-2558(+)